MTARLTSGRAATSITELPAVFADIVHHPDVRLYSANIAIHVLAGLALRQMPHRKLAIAGALCECDSTIGALPIELASPVANAVSELGLLTQAEASTLVSRFYELLLGFPASGSVTARAMQGAFYTPEPLVEHLVRHTISQLPNRSTPRICDPACGTGNFLLAAGNAFGQNANAWQSLYGTDIDLAAVLICRWRIWIASGCNPQVWKHVCRSICVGDSLGAPPPALTGAARRDWKKKSPAPPSDGHSWAGTSELHRGKQWRGFDIILGNPPFLSQLSRSTTHDTSRQAWLRYRYGDLVRPYTDAAAIFLAHAIEHLAPAGRIGMVLPSSVLSTRDCAKIRQYTAEHATIESVWINPVRAFSGVNVLTCALVAKKNDKPSTAHCIQTYIGPECAKGDVIRISHSRFTAAQTWGIFTRGLTGLPAIHIKHTRTLADIAIATADFRDQYYGLNGHIYNATTPPKLRHAPLITSGLLDLARSHWGRRDTRILKHPWQAPVVNLDKLQSQTSLGPWAMQRRVPKVLLATQSRILEPWVDQSGTSLPCVPIITITPRTIETNQLWLIGAVLASPVVSAFARVEFAGAALSAEAIKLSAKQCLALPLPASSAFTAMAEGFKTLSDPAATQEALDTFAQAAIRGYGLPARTAAAILSWWLPLAQKSRFGPV